jgi:hypothetical protein
VEVQVVTSGQRAPVWLVALFVVIGLCIVAAAALGVIPTDPSAAPRWVVGAFGGLFVASSLLMLSLRDPAALQSPHVSLLAAIFFSMFAAIFGWVGFGGGPRHFSTTVTFLNGATHGSTGETTGRIAFDAVAVLVAVPAILLWWSFAKGLIYAMRRVPEG